MTCKLKAFCKQGETCVAHEGYDIWKCTGFKEKGAMTNEEWLHTLNTEQLAEWLANTFDLCGAGCRKCFIKELCFDEHINKTPNDLIVEWLKQPHKGGES